MGICDKPKQGRDIRETEEPFPGFLQEVTQSVSAQWSLQPPGMAPPGSEYMEGSNEHRALASLWSAVFFLAELFMKLGPSRHQPLTS